MSLALVEAQFSSFIQFLKKEGLPIMKAVLNIGLQSDGVVWVLGEDLHIDVDGIIIDRTNHVYTWLSDMVSEGLCSMSLAEVLPKITVPLNSFILQRYISHLMIIRISFIALTGWLSCCRL